ncbi:imidazolonepropionase-like amidohydrolase [Hymenobacter luteus]|uniref:Imidazolonepropionase-like amidohydrolase n=2 Tax=Hymenobacter TaxID=89966 RepID=A0A7W9WAM9_9BACT|nr:MULTISPECIES: amidohydrolase family protein [Hymenobacter]MBB4600864.1 imidazolonepropionase-like amidohydrolase [Hymenobacter latericoloratus]MBB6058929.1 imidazolonepropionase-like amidohydrolase [Hymenobacter luteus]
MRIDLRRLGLAGGLLAGSLTAAHAQQPATFPRNGVYDQRPGLYAFTHATIFLDYKTRLDDATLLIRDGKVEAVGPKVKIPAGAVVQDLKGRFIYPGFVDLYASYGVPEVKAPERQGRRSGPQLESTKAGAYDWNQAIHPEVNAAELFRVNAEQAEAYRRQGFGAVLTHQPDGIARGTAALVSLSSSRRESEVLLQDRSAATFSFEKGSSTQDYPSSLMGSIALLRQSYLDADWNQRNPTREQNLSLRALTQQRQLPAIFEVRDKLNALRADKLGDEFGVQYIIKGRGDEYQRIADIKATQAPLILTLNFPDAYQVDDVYDAARVSLQELKHWEMAPANPAMLAKAGVPFALSAADLKDKKKFLPNLRKAVQYGLSEQQALKALTATPAALVKAQDRVGALRPGMEANFLVCSGRLLAEDNVLLDNWVQGERYQLSTLPVDYRGVYKLSMTTADKVKDNEFRLGADMTLLIQGKPDAPQLKVVGSPGDTIKGSLTVSGELATIVFNTRKGKDADVTRLSGYYTPETRTFQGDGQLSGTQTGWTNIKWTARRLEEATRAARRDSVKAPVPPQLGAVQYPFVAYGRPEVPAQQTVLIKNATVWTSEAAGKLENTDVLLQNGKIVRIGRNLSVPSGGRSIDGTGKHLTPGIIDEHSHLAISGGVNEGTQSVTSEVSIGDVVDPEDVDVYRDLAGGVVAAQLLHGSANPIGGQSALIKMRWGMTPEQMKIAGAPGFIKFALGENVKQSNWGELNVVRFPQTRMGTEQVFVDAFTRAKEYEQEWKAWNKLSKGKQKKGEAPRRDLELEALVEILNRQRFITCHSYVQSEINMLMNVSDRMGFPVNTFTHILEGYKVADKMKQRNINASTFSDWWAYKNEVRDAIPYNAGIMHDVGLNVALNSDDAEMSRRLNQEAAKMVKYSNLSEEEALKMVTINPAKMLHLDRNMGSIKEGKDADVVLWTDNPLSVYARAERTFVDGREMFSLETDQQLRQQLEQERLRIVQKMLDAKKGGAATQLPTAKPNQHYHCDTEGQAKELDK